MKFNGEKSAICKILMDKVTQQNAASSEDSASISEELNAQVEQMKDMVDELVIMVGGSASSNLADMQQASDRKQNTAGMSTLSRSVFEKKTNRETGVSPGRGRLVRPNEIIPVDENDFKDF